MKSIPAESVALFKGDSVVVRSRRKNETLVGHGTGGSNAADTPSGEWQI